MPKIILLGDSLIEFMPKDTIFKEGYEVINFGECNIGIETYRLYRWPWENIDKSSDNIYILEIGINNILRPDCDYDEEQSLDNVNNKLKRLITDILKDTSARLIVQSLYPTKYNDKNKYVIEVNKRLLEFCIENNIEYLDMYSIFVGEDGVILNKYSDDGIHPNDLGYKIVGDVINSAIG